MPSRSFRPDDPTLRRLIPQESRAGGQRAPVVGEPARCTDLSDTSALSASETSPIALSPATVAVPLGSPAAGTITHERWEGTR